MFKRSIGLAVGLLSVLFYSGCATHGSVAFTPQLESSLEGAAVAPTARPASNLFVYSTGDATAGILGGAIGGGIAGAMGDKTVNEELRSAGIVFPGEVLRPRLLERLRLKYQTVVLGSEGVVLDEEQRQFAPSASTTSARYILDADARWMCSYLPLNWTRYQFQIVYSVRLLDRATGQVLFNDQFPWKTPKALGYPSRKEFTTDPDKGVKAQLEVANAAAEAYFAERLRL